MKPAYVLVLVLLMGCSSSDDVGDRPSMDEDATSSVDKTPSIVDAGHDAATSCGLNDVVETVLPAVGGSNAVALCTVCDVAGCLNMGDPCDAYGDPCNMGDLPGVCVSCCNGSVGELHCSPITR